MQNDIVSGTFTFHLPSLVTRASKWPDLVRETPVYLTSRCFRLGAFLAILLRAGGLNGPVRTRLDAGGNAGAADDFVLTCPERALANPTASK